MKDLKRITVRMIPPEGHREDQYTFRAPPGRHYTPESIDICLADVIEYLDKKFPWWDFKMVPVGVGKYNFVYAGLRENASDNSSATDTDAAASETSIRGPLESGDLSAVPPPKIS